MLKSIMKTGIMLIWLAGLLVASAAGGFTFEVMSRTSTPSYTSHALAWFCPPPPVPC